MAGVGGVARATGGWASQWRRVRSGTDRALQNALLVSAGSSVDRRSQAPTSSAPTAGRRSGTRARAAEATVSSARSVTSSARTGSSMRAGRPRRVKVSTMSAKGRATREASRLTRSGLRAAVRAASPTPIASQSGLSRWTRATQRMVSREVVTGVEACDDMRVPRGRRCCAGSRSNPSSQPPEADVYPVDVAAYRAGRSPPEGW